MNGEHRCNTTAATSMCCEVEVAAGGEKFSHGMIVPFNSNAAISQDRVPGFLFTGMTYIDEQGYGYSRIMFFNWYISRILIHGMKGSGDERALRCVQIEDVY
jgi:hypothetical protein